MTRVSSGAHRAVSLNLCPFFLCFERLFSFGSAGADDLDKKHMGHEFCIFKNLYYLFFKSNVSQSFCTVGFPRSLKDADNNVRRPYHFFFFYYYIEFVEDDL